MRKHKLITILLGILINVTSYSQNPTVQNIINAISIDSIKLTIQQLSGNAPVTVGSNTYTLTTRHDSLPGNEIAFQFLKRKLISYGLSPDSTVFAFSSPQITGTTGKNLILKKTGTTYPGKQFIICGHYDSQCPTPHLNCPGADDNASSCASIIEAARIMKNYSFPFTILYILWDSEELPPNFKNGSRDYVLNKSPNDTILGVFNVEQIGYDSNGDDSATVHSANVSSSPFLSNKMNNVNSIYNIGLKLFLLNPGITTSDHHVFWLNNYSAICLSGFYKTATLNDVTPFWHSPGDVYSTLNIPFLKKTATLAIATLAECAIDPNNVFLGVKYFSNESTNLHAFPNPFQNIIEIHYDVFSSSHVQVSIYNIHGEFVKHLVNENQPRGEYNITWDGKNNTGMSLSNGVYLYSVKIGNQSYNGKVILNK